LIYPVNTLRVNNDPFIGGVPPLNDITNIKYASSVYLEIGLRQFPLPGSRIGNKRGVNLGGQVALVKWFKGRYQPALGSSQIELDEIAPCARNR